MGSDLPPSGQRPSAPQGQNRPQQRPQGQQAQQRQPQTKFKYGENKNRGSEFAMMPFVFCSFMFGLVNMLAVPVIYCYEIIKNNEKDQWPAWSGLDGLNWLFFEKHPLIVRKDILYHVNEQNMPVQVINLHVPALTSFMNQVVIGYLDMAVAFICFLQGVVFLTVATRIAIRVLDKPKPTQLK